jgi:hypothetical protein
MHVHNNCIPINLIILRFDIPMLVTLKNTVFWYVKACSLIRESRLSLDWLLQLTWHSPHTDLLQ